MLSRIIKARETAGVAVGHFNFAELTVLRAAAKYDKIVTNEINALFFQTDTLVL